MAFSMLVILGYELEPDLHWPLFSTLTLHTQYLTTLQKIITKSESLSWQCFSVQQFYVARYQLVLSEENYALWSYHL